jgi:hypothetical protein
MCVCSIEYGRLSLLFVFNNYDKYESVQECESEFVSVFIGLTRVQALVSSYLILLP